MRETLLVPGPEPIVHDTEARRYELDLGDDVAVLEYVPVAGGVIFTHTGVPPLHEGRGVGTRLVAAGLDDARRQGWRIVARCPFVARFVRDHPEYADLLASPRPGG